MVESRDCIGMVQAGAVASVQAGRDADRSGGGVGVGIRVLSSVLGFQMGVDARSMRRRGTAAKRANRSEMHRISILKC